MTDMELVNRIADCLPLNEEEITFLCNELSQVDEDSFIKTILLRLCGQVEDLNYRLNIEVAISMQRHARIIKDMER